MNRIFDKNTLSVNCSVKQDNDILIEVSADFAGAERKSQLYVNEDGIIKDLVEDLWKKVRSKTAKIQALSMSFEEIDWYDSDCDRYTTPTFRIRKGLKRVKVGARDHSDIPKAWGVNLVARFSPMRQKTAIKTYLTELGILSSKELDTVMKGIAKAMLAENKYYRFNRE